MKEIPAKVSIGGSLKGSKLEGKGLKEINFYVQFLYCQEEKQPKIPYFLFTVSRHVTKKKKEGTERHLRISHLICC